MTLNTRPDFELRDYQKQAISQTYRLIRSGIRSVVLVAPTGAGKTCVGSRIVNDAVRRGRRVLFLVHRDPLVPQTQDELLNYGIVAGIIKAGYRENRELPVQIASIQSLARRDLPKDIGLVIIDECHTVGWYQAFEEVKQTYSPCGVPALGKTVYIGLTGSPWRSKPKEHFGEHFEAIVRVPGPKSPEDEKKFLTVRLIERGFLVPPRNFGWGGFLRSDLLEKADGEFTQKSLEAAVSHPEFNSHVVKKFLEVATDRSGIVFCASVKQSRELSALFNNAGLRCEHIEADTPHEVRREMYSRLRNGETQLLSSVGTLTEGFNVKNISTIVLARPTASEALLIQMCGRGLDDCLRQLVQTPEILRLALMFFLVNVAWADKALKPGEEKALDLAEDRLWILRFKREAIESFVQTVRIIHEQDLSDKEASNLLKEAVAKLESADIPLSTIDPKKISTNFASAHTSYSEGSFWQKVKDFALVAGREVLEKALILYYAAQNPQIPIWAKSSIYAALAYFISPLDGIPDVLPVVGFTDDFATLAAAMAIVAMYITPEVKEQAKQKLEDWFGSKTPVG